MIRVALFDLDDTLFAHREAVARGIVSHMAATGGFDGADPHAAVDLWHALEEKHYHSYLAGELDFEGQRRARARDFAAAHGIELGDTASGAWFTIYFEQHRAAWSLHDDALPCLDALESRIPGLRFGIITNGDPVFQARKLDQVGLSGRIEHVIASGELGVIKPDSRIFRHACDVFGVAPDEAAYVGDRLETDAIGAANAGLLGVWLDREGAATDAELEEARAAGVRVIRSLADVPAALAG
jgi:putative hydrolase of the HAD superfamily